MPTTNPNRMAAFFLAVCTLGLLPADAQDKGKSFPDQFQEKWEKSGPNVMIKRHQDGSRTEFKRSPDSRTLVKRTYGINGAPTMITVYIVDAGGNPRSCKIWDGKKTLLYKVSYAYNKTTGRLEGERMFDARSVRLNPKDPTKEQPVRVMYYNYDAQGRQTKPEVFTFKDGLRAEDAYGTFPHDNPFDRNR